MNKYAAKELYDFRVTNIGHRKMHKEKIKAIESRIAFMKAAETNTIYNAGKGSKTTSKVKAGTNGAKKKGKSTNTITDISQQKKSGFTDLSNVKCDRTQLAIRQNSIHGGGGSSIGIRTNTDVTDMVLTDTATQRQPTLTKQPTDRTNNQRQPIGPTGPPPKVDVYVYDKNDYDETSSDEEDRHPDEVEEKNAGNADLIKNQAKKPSKYQLGGQNDDDRADQHRNTDNNGNYGSSCFHDNDDQAKNQAKKQFKYQLGGRGYGRGGFDAYGRGAFDVGGGYNRRGSYNGRGGCNVGGYNGYGRRGNGQGANWIGCEFVEIPAFGQRVFTGLLKNVRNRRTGFLNEYCMVDEDFSHGQQEYFTHAKSWRHFYDLNGFYQCDRCGQDARYYFQIAEGMRILFKKMLNVSNTKSNGRTEAVDLQLLGTGGKLIQFKRFWSCWCRGFSYVPDAAVGMDKNVNEDERQEDQ